MFGKTKRLATGLFVGATLLASNAMAALTMPTADYTDIEAAAALGIGITLVVGLLYKAKGFVR